ncbi:MAG: ABC transporter permease subunit/CPBP intramembrane protease [Vicinamibacterales bacterium]
MRLSIIRTILLKELRETLRDRRTLLLTVGLPVLLYPLAILAFTRIAESGEDAIDASRSPVAVWGTLPPAVARELGAVEALTLMPWAGVPEVVREGLQSGTLTRVAAADVAGSTPGARRRGAGSRTGPEIEPENPVLAAAREAVASRTVEAVVVAWADAAPNVARGAAATITLYYDSVRRESVVAQGRVADALSDARDAVIAERQRTRALPDGFAQAIALERRNTARAERRSGQLLGSLLPYILLTLSVLGGMYAAVDLTAGEKERGTMQTLLVAPIRPAEIVVAKFLAVWLLSMLSLVANLASLSLTVSRLLPADVPGVGLGNLALALVVLVPVTLTTSALFLTLASFARDFRDGQTLLTPMYMAVVLPAAVVAMPTITLNAWTAFVPVVNVTLLIKALFLREATADLVFLTLVSASAYAAVAIAAAVHVFHRETVLVGERASVRTVFERGLGRPIPTPGLALAMFAVVLVVAFYGSLAMGGWPIHQALLVLQYGGFLLPTVAVIWLFAFDPRRTLALYRPSPGAVIAAAALGATAWLVAGGLVGRLLPPPESLTRAMQRLIQLGDDPMPLWVVWLVIGLTPALCEELFFRGLIFAGLRRLGAWPAVLIAALLFGLAHASIYRLLPTFTLGVLLGVVRWRSGSVVPGIVMHAVNNGLVGTLAQRPDLVARLGMDMTAGTMPWAPVAAGTAVTAAALGLLWRTTRPGSDAAADGRTITTPAPARPAPDRP